MGLSIIIKLLCLGNLSFPIDLNIRAQILQTSCLTKEFVPIHKWLKLDMWKHESSKTQKILFPFFLPSLHKYLFRICDEPGTILSTANRSKPGGKVPAFMDLYPSRWWQIIKQIKESKYKQIHKQEKILDCNKCIKNIRLWWI